MKLLRVAMYCRISSEFDPAPDIDKLLDFCKGCGWNITHAFVENDAGVETDKCPALDHLLAHARRREFDAAWVWMSKTSFSRLFLPKLNHALETIRALGIKLVSLQNRRGDIHFDDVLGYTDLLEDIMNTVQGARGPRKQ